MFLTRKQYDSLINQFPNWMSENWNKLTTLWFIDGIKVVDPSDSEREFYANLMVMISTLKVLGIK